MESLKRSEDFTIDAFDLLDAELHAALHAVPIIFDEVRVRGDRPLEPVFGEEVLLEQRGGFY